MTIWKYTLKIQDEQIIKIPRVNKPLSIQVQSSTPQLWAMVDPESPLVRAKVCTFGTGREGITADMDYLGTFQIHDGSLVFHVFFAGWTTD